MRTNQSHRMPRSWGSCEKRLTSCGQTKYRPTMAIPKTRIWRSGSLFRSAESPAAGPAAAAERGSLASPDRLAPHPSPAPNPARAARLAAAAAAERAAGDRRVPCRCRAYRGPCYRFPGSSGTPPLFSPPAAGGPRRHGRRRDKLPARRRERRVVDHPHRVRTVRPRRLVPGAAAFPQDRAPRASRGHRATGDAAGRRPPQRLPPAGRHRRGSGRALPVPRLPPFPVDLDGHDPGPADRRRLPPGRRRLRGRGRRPRRRLHRGHLLAGRAGRSRRRLGGGLRGLLRRRPGGPRTPRASRSTSRPTSPAPSVRGSPRRPSPGAPATATAAWWPSASAGPRTPPPRLPALSDSPGSLGLGSVPHAGEAAGPASIRGALSALHADRIRHGIRAVEDPALVVELAQRGIVST